VIARFVLAALVCTGCQELFHLQKVADVDGAPSVDAASDGIDGANLAFVTSQKYVPGSLGSVDAADALCGSLAAAAGHPGHYVAWLSSSTSSATARIGTTARGWVRADGRPFADTLVDIVQGRVWYPLRLTEKGDDVATTGDPTDLTVATGTEANGSTSIYTCDDYTNPAMSAGVTAGLADNSPYGWSSLMGGICGTPQRLYCFGTDHVAPVTLVPESSRHAFVSENDVTSGAPLSSYDQECGNEAAAAQLPGMYRAAMATTSQAVLDRFTPGPPWVRFDGVTVIDSSGKQLAPILYNAGGGFDITIAWSGASSLLTKAPTAAASCRDWTATDTTVGLTGNVSRSGGEAFGGIPNQCNIAIRVYCLEDQ
jgi:hypothetical protein